jgi:hypothetical protein
VAKKWENWTFGELDATLSNIHEIADNKRTAFQSRLKNFHRLRFPLYFKSEKGRTSFYTAEQVVQMALAIELTQLGLPPERTALVLTLNWFPAMMAMRLAAQELQKHPGGFDYDKLYAREDNPDSIFLFFDPAALSTLMLGDNPAHSPDIDITARSFFYGSAKVVAENIVGWTAVDKARISLINMTKLIDDLVSEPRHRNTRASFFAQIADWSDAYEAERGDWCAEEHVFDFLECFKIGSPDQTEDEALAELARNLHIKLEIVRRCWTSYLESEERRANVRSS